MMTGVTERFGVVVGKGSVGVNIEIQMWERERDVCWDCFIRKNDLVKKKGDKGILKLLNEARQLNWIELNGTATILWVSQIIQI